MRSIIFIITLLSLTACGPEQTNRDAEKTELEIMAQQQKALLDRQQGYFEGTMTQLDGKTTFPVRLSLETFVTFAPVPNRADLVAIPTMIGNLNAGNQSGNLSWTFTQGTYFPAESSLKLLGRSDTNASAPVSYLILKFEGPKVTGKLVVGRLTSTVELKRIR